MVWFEPGENIGMDQPANHDPGNGTAARQRAYQLVRQQKPITDFEIQFAEPGVEAFAFTFG